MVILAAQLLRPYNDRDWKYGGSWENRSRFAFETCERIRRAVPDPKFLIGARVSMYEEMPGGQGHAGADSFCYDLSESIALLQGLEARGCSYFGETIGNASVYWENMAPSPSCSTNVYQHLTMAKSLKGGRAARRRSSSEPVCQCWAMARTTNCGAYSRSERLCFTWQRMLCRMASWIWWGWDARRWPTRICLAKSRANKPRTCNGA